MSERESKPSYEPTRAEIRRAAEAIRLGWSPAETRKRAPHLAAQSEFRLPTIHDENRYSEFLIDE